MNESNDEANNNNKKQAKIVLNLNDDDDNDDNNNNNSAGSGNNSKDFVDELRSAVEKIETSKKLEFAIGGVIREWCMPNIEIQGVGLIALPIDAEQVTKLKKVATKSPHGRGSKTVHDDKVRNSLQVF